MENSMRVKNVVHEAGLFQGRLGFKKAILLLEETCEKFSNIDGLGYIPFPTGEIRAAFEDIREVLKREGLIEVGSSSNASPPERKGRFSTRARARQGIPESRPDRTVFGLTVR